ncbi:MAG: hypothetical protein PHU69_13740 [Fermentimonas sp.]|nr:hypothetical protein [Fermentimonas sp.]
MMQIKKSLLVLMLAAVVFLTSVNFVYANAVDDEKQIETIKISAENSLNVHKAALEADKTNFGVSDSESFDNTTLGKGYPFYVISSELLNNQNYENILSFRGYIFPIMIGDKTIGFATVVESNGKGDIQKISNITTFEKDIAEAKSLLNNSTNKLIYDDNLHLFALIEQNDSEYNILPIRNNDSLGLVKHQKKSLNESAEKILLYHKEMTKDKMELGGGTDPIKDNRNMTSNIFGLTAGIVLLITACIVYRRKLNTGEK